MSLIKCSECGKEISNKANACPFCGNPSNAPVEGKVVPTEVELTNKRWKKTTIVAFLLLVIGFLTLPHSLGLGIVFILSGFGLRAVSLFGSWWTNG